MRFQQTPKENSQPVESTDSGSAQNTISQPDSDSPVSIKASSEQCSEQQQQGMIASEVPGAGAATPNHQPRTQEKTLRRLAQNREAARKSRLRKKAYVQQLESSRIKLTQLEQDLQRARSQGLLFGGASAGGNTSSAAAIFDMEHDRWLDENYKHMTNLRGGLQAQLPESDLRVIVDECLTHYDEMFRLKGIAAKSDVFHLITGMWTTPAERCFLWMGGFRPSELLKEILIPQLGPLTEQQLVGICNLQQSSQQAEEALSQGLEKLHQSLRDTVSSGSLCEGTNVGNYMDQMGVALGKLANLEGFVRQVLLLCPTFFFWSFIASSPCHWEIIKSTNIAGEDGYVLIFHISDGKSERVLIAHRRSVWINGGRNWTGLCYNPIMSHDKCVTCRCFACVPINLDTKQLL